MFKTINHYTFICENFQIGVINSTNIGVEYMSVSKGYDGGTIINVASVAGLDAIYSIPAYTASKHGVIGFTECLAVSNKTRYHI